MSWQPLGHTRTLKDRQIHPLLLFTSSSSFHSFSPPSFGLIFCANSRRLCVYSSAWVNLFLLLFPFSFGADRCCCCCCCCIFSTLSHSGDCCVSTPPVRLASVSFSPVLQFSLRKSERERERERPIQLKILFRFPVGRGKERKERAFFLSLFSFL